MRLSFIYLNFPKRMLNICCIVIFLLCAACSTGLKVSKSQFKPIDIAFSGTFRNTVVEISGKDSDETLLQIFGIYNINSDSIKLTCSETGLVIIEFHDSLSIMKNKTRKEVFQGEKSRRGYFEIFLAKKKIDIPPIIPIFYSNRNIYRIRIGLTKSNDLIIDNMKDVGGNFFIFIANGYKTRTQYYFENLKKNNARKPAI